MTSILIGALAVVASAYLAAVYLSADAVRLGQSDLAGAFRTRALIAGLFAGALAIGGLVLLHAEAHRLFHRLLDGPGLPALSVSVLAGIAALTLVWASRFEAARYTAALAVAAIIAGWALAQQPLFLHGLTIQHAAAGHDVLVIVVVAVLGGAAILFPSLALLFRLVLGGRLGAGAGTAEYPAVQTVISASASGLLGRVAFAALIAGIGLLTIAEAGWAHAFGVVCLFACVVLGFAAIAPAELAERGPP